MLQFCARPTPSPTRTLPLSGIIGLRVGSAVFPVTIPHYTANCRVSRAATASNNPPHAPRCCRQAEYDVHPSRQRPSPGLIPRVNRPWESWYLVPVLFINKPERGMTNHLHTPKQCGMVRRKSAHSHHCIFYILYLTGYPNHLGT